MTEEIEIGIGPAEKLSILYTGDLHGNVEKMKYLSTVIKQERERQPGALLLDSGDWSKGGPIADKFKGKPMAEIMEYLRYDAVALGEADLSWGIRGLAHLASIVTFPFLCANISGELPANFKAYTLKVVQNVRVGIIGISPAQKLPERHITMLSPEEGLQEALKEISAEKAEILILLSHLGVEQDREIGKRFPMLSVIIGGHSHIKLDEPEHIGQTLLVHGGAYGEYLGSLDLNIGSTISFKKK